MGGSGVRIGSEGGDDLGGGGARLELLSRLARAVSGPADVAGIQVRRSPSRAEQIAAASGDPSKLDQLLTPGFAPVVGARPQGLLAALARLLRGGS